VAQVTVTGKGVALTQISDEQLHGKACNEFQDCVYFRPIVEAEIHGNNI
jgi:hypothetical protein